MTISGGIKFFETSKCLYKDGARAYSLHGDNAQYILSHNRDNGYTSTNSDDLTTEQLIIDLPEVIDINRIILNQHNFKDVTIYLLNESNKIEQENGSILLSEDSENFITEQSTFEDENWSRFVIQEDGFFLTLDQNPAFKIKSEQFINTAAVPTSDVLQRTITASDIDTSTSYFYFDSTRCIRVMIECTTTQTPNQQKSLQALILTNEIGTLVGFPNVKTEFNRHIIADQVLSGKTIIQKGADSFSASIDLNSYPGQADLDLIKLLHDSDDDFLIWLCGGREGSAYYQYTAPGWGIDDIYPVNSKDPMPLEYVYSITSNPYSTRISIIEVP